MEFKNKTLILITHKIETLKFFDKIYVIDEGVIIEEGNYNYLLQKDKSLFNKFLKSEINN